MNNPNKIKSKRLTKKHKVDYSHTTTSRIKLSAVDPRVREILWDIADIEQEQTTVAANFRTHAENTDYNKRLKHRQKALKQMRNVVALEKLIQKNPPPF